MKKAIAALIITAGAFMAGRGSVQGSTQETEAPLYFRGSSASIIAMDPASDSFTVMDNDNGFTYEFDGIEDWQLGDDCVIVFASESKESFEAHDIVALSYDRPDMKGTWTK